MVDYGFPWDTNTVLPGRSPGFSCLATTPTCLLTQTLWFLILHCCFGPEDRLNNYVSIQIPAHYFSYDILRTVNEDSLTCMLNEIAAVWLFVCRALSLAVQNPDNLGKEVVFTSGSVGTEAAQASARR